MGVVVNAYQYKYVGKLKFCSHIKTCSCQTRLVFVKSDSSNMKIFAFVCCFSLIAIQTMTSSEETTVKTDEKPKGTYPDDAKWKEIKNTITGLTTSCREIIEGLDMQGYTLEEGCQKLEDFTPVLKEIGCDDGDFKKMKDVLCV